MEQIGGAGFALMVPFLGAFIANSIAGRSAIAPAAIISFFANQKEGDAFFNYQTGEFGGFANPVSLGFFGALLAGYLVGYGVKYFNDNVKIHKSLQAATPIFIIPLVFSFVG
jgi:PTS system fructose-specific IIC component